MPVPYIGAPFEALPKGGSFHLILVTMFSVTTLDGLFPRPTHDHRHPTSFYLFPIDLPAMFDI